MKQPTEQQIIDATNLLAEVAQKLPADYQILLSMSSEESSLELIDPDGESHFEITSEWNYSGISAAIDLAVSLELERH